MTEKENKIIGFINNPEYKPMKLKEMAHFMEVPAEARDDFNKIIEGLELQGKLIVTKKGKIMLPETLNMCCGVFSGNAKGFGFVIKDDGSSPDIFIPASKTNGAINKDKVLCKIVDDDNMRRPEGEIIKVIERGYNEIIGTFQKVRSYGFVIPDDKKLPDDIIVYEKNSKGAVTGHKVAVKIIKSKEDGKNAEGIITEILGHKNDPGVDITSIIRSLNIPMEFDQEIFNELDYITEDIPEAEIARRKDLRNVQTITVDGPHTKDVDDAVTLEILENGCFKLGVHIADVTHYVKYNSALDKEAFKRGTSVYLVDRVIPMLPHKLSNGVCSLNAECDRLALSCIMEIDKSGVVLSHEIANTVINVDKAINYDIVNEILTDESTHYIQENTEFLSMLKGLEELSTILRKKRIKRGALEFDFPESEIYVDENGKPTDIVLRKRNVATSIIEECMLICNETVAERFFWLELPFVYRSHEEPDSEKLRLLSEFARHFGYRLKGQGNHAGSLQALLSKIDGAPEETVISRVMLRSLKQAKYTADNLGHFGLCAKYYCHFTSPIRRYPDLQIHRIIKMHLDGADESTFASLRDKMPEITRQCSVTERNAEVCEREVEDLKKAEYMENHIGEEFAGVISGVTSYGIFVVLPNIVEGMIEVSSLYDDLYVYDKDSMSFTGSHTNKKYGIGQKVNIKVKGVNVDAHTIDFDLI